MSIRPVSVKVNSIQQGVTNKSSRACGVTSSASSPSFAGGKFKINGGFIVRMMEAIGAGGVCASFVIQDFGGMGIPRVWRGLHRNEKETGHLNYSFATQEFLREAISGPATFAIPLAVLAMSSHASGKTVNVPATYIKTFGDNFTEYASKAKDLSNKKVLKEGFYYDTVEKMLSNSTELRGDALKSHAKAMTENRIKYEDMASKESGIKKAVYMVKGFLNTLFNKKNKPSNSSDQLNKIQEEFLELRKQYNSADADLLTAEMSSNASNKWASKIGEGEYKVGTTIDRFVKNLINYTDCVSDRVCKKASELTSGEKIADFMKGFTEKKIGSRALTGLSMLAMTCVFFAFIPKIYKRKNGNPGMDGLGATPQNGSVPQAKPDETKKGAKA